MTRDELIAKRQRKKKNRILGAVAAGVSACGLIFGIWSGVIPAGKCLEKAEDYAWEQLGQIVGGMKSYFVARTGDGPMMDSLIVPALNGQPETTTAVSEPEIPGYDGPTGWQQDSEGRYYLDNEGVRLTGWYQDTDGVTYLLNKDGYVQTGWQEPDIGRVYLGDDGALAVGLREIDGELYYFGYDGVNLSGWQDVGVKTYYFSPENGTAVKGWTVIKDEDCYFGEDGVYDPEKKKGDLKNISGPVVALTFDDGPGIYTDAILDVLEQNGAKATFFMLGSLVNSFPSSVKREHDIGMEQGNHSWDHPTLTKISNEQIYNQVNSTSTVIQEVTGDRPTVFRPPGGGVNDSVYENCCDLPLILWSIDTLDWKTRDAQATYDTVMSTVGDGDIILMHEIYQSSLDAVRMIVPALIERGYTFVTVSELAKIKGVELHGWHKYGKF